MKIHPGHAHWLFSLIMSMIVTFIVTCALTAFNHGFDGFVLNWMHSFLIAWAVAFPCVLIAAPQVRNLVQRLIHH
jgi:hypothetical protein